MHAGMHVRVHACVAQQWKLGPWSSSLQLTDVALSENEAITSGSH